MKIKDLQKNQRPRERLIEKGAASLSDAELLAVLLASGTKQENVMEMAARICARYPFSDLKELTYPQLIALPGIKMAKACQLLACFEIVRRSFCITGQKEQLDSAQKIYQFAYPKMMLQKKETMMIIYLNAKLQVLYHQHLSSYHPTSIEVPVRLIVEEALFQKAYAVVLLHNHPSSDLTPSKADLSMTDYLKNLLESLEIVLLDHLIVSDQNYYSFLEKGLIATEEA